MNAFSVLALGAVFISGADNLTALFAGNSHGVFAVALWSVGGFGLGMLASDRGNGDGNFLYFTFGNFFACYQSALSNSGNKFCFGFCGNILFGCKCDVRQAFSDINGHAIGV